MSVNNNVQLFLFCGCRIIFKIKSISYLKTHTTITIHIHVFKLVKSKLI